MMPGQGKLLGSIALCVLVLNACRPDHAEVPKEEPLPDLTPPHFPEMPVPERAPLTSKRIALGKKLFFDPILSRDKTISCGTCHLPHKAFTDGQAVAIGIEGRKHFRNSPTLFNVAWQPYLFMDGGNPSLESQVLGPIEEHVEMDLPFTEAMARVAQHPDYPPLFEEAFGEGVNPFTLTTALATYQRSLVSAQSHFDRYWNGDLSALSQEERKGLDLFKSEALKCNQCHELPLTTNFAFENNGSASESDDDQGRYRVSLDSADRGKFKVATLRNVAFTAPYMHDGSIADLSAVIDHYASGGQAHLNKSQRVQGFRISDSEKSALLAFLKSLSDTSSYRQFQP